MILAGDGLRVALVTGHLPLKEVSEAVTLERIVTKARLFHQSLERDFAVVTPRIALLGLNPHAGDGGMLGSEDAQRIAPAARQLQAEGIDARGPFAADGFFGSGAYKHFGHGVNFTAGLPIVRTSPDHGTGLGIAGQGTADEGSFRAAVWLACDIRENRERFKLIGANPLQPQKREKDKA
jgi:4-hydroxythreonine-4-phosphate dehydrogenase